MATTTTVPAKYDEETGLRTTPVTRRDHSRGLWPVLDVLASLKLTVTLLALAIGIVFVGTLAQAELDMWDVIRLYFAAPLAWVNLQVFFPPAFFPSGPPIPAIHLPYPGGASIGLLMIINLLAAHLLRFRIHARGITLLSGLAVTVLGLVMTGTVIALGHNQEGLQGQPFFAWPQFWWAIKVVLTVIWTLLFYPVVRLTLRSRAPRYLEAALVAGVHCGLTALLAYLFSSKFAMSESSLRILWQLIQGQTAALVLLAGFVMLFRKRAGIVLIHAGILLMMGGEFVATRYNVEERIALQEGETTRYAEDLRTAELAVIDRSPAEHDHVVVIPRELLQTSLDQKSRITDPRLPFDVQVVEFFKNSRLRRVQSEDKNPADAGLGLEWVAEYARPAAGASGDARVDTPSCYVQLFEKGSGNSLGKYLLASVAGVSDVLEETTVDGRDYSLCLRFKRSYKPYALTLKDVVREDHRGTTLARNYSSIVRIVDDSRREDREVKIWMNNPLRFAGETFYQSKYDPGDENNGWVETSEFQVVKNLGWMIPYVACMIVATGLVAHFWGTLMRFIQRREQAVFAEGVADPYAQVASADAKAKRQAKQRKREPRAATDSVQDPKQRMQTAFTLVIATLGLVWLLYPAIRQKQDHPSGMDLKAFGELPVLFEGRVKPLDSVARNALMIVSNRDYYRDADDQRQPAIRWLLDVVSDSPQALDHRVVRIENLDVLQTLGLERRKGYRYAVEEFNSKMEDLERQMALAAEQAETDKTKLTVYQRKLLELHHRLDMHLRLTAGFRTLPLPETMPTAEQFRLNPDQAGRDAQLIRQLLSRAPDFERELTKIKPPQAIPTQDKGWAPLASEYTLAYRMQLHNVLLTAEKPQPVNEAALTFHNMLQAYAKDDAGKFNFELRRYQQLLAKTNPEMYSAGRTTFEAYYNRYAPIFLSQWAYFVAFVLAAIAWLGWSRPLNRAAFVLIVMTFFVHTFALGARIYISGRPPVTNLYSSAIFIGWGAAIFGMGLEFLYRMGIGNIVASVGGFATLIIAGALSKSGETMPVLEAVLDTQFWLSTHVVCITLGYCATFVAGLLGLIYIIAGLFESGLDTEDARKLIRMTYGTLCFALTFSFIGTVLGGLWADDSWGRFWGWDPKENGALIIVLWNALVLHARWDGLVRARGLAALAVGGNITTAWSWFGVNELGIGLHSYGFTEGVMLALGLFVLSQLVVIGLSFAPRRVAEV
jgi:ABC-type transport system involved in cytochrome c biogenesis permease subunit